MRITVTTERGSVVAWEDGAFSGDPSIVDVAEASAAHPSPIPIMQGGPLLHGDRFEPRYALLIMLQACMMLRLGAVTVEGAPEFPPVPFDPDVEY